MSYLYTPTPSWASSVTIPADSDAGRASGELATSIKTIANRNAWLAGQVVHEMYLSRISYLGSVTSTESSFARYHDICAININTTGFQATLVTSTIVVSVGTTTTTIPVVLVVNGTYTGATSHRIDVSVPYPSGAISAPLFGATTVQSDSVPVCVYSYYNSVPTSPRNSAALASVRFDIYKVRS